MFGLHTYLLPLATPHPAPSGPESRAFLFPLASILTQHSTALLPHVHIHLALVSAHAINAMHVRGEVINGLTLLHLD